MNSSMQLLSLCFRFGFFQGWVICMIHFVFLAKWVAPNSAVSALLVPTPRQHYTSLLYLSCHWSVQFFTGIFNIWNHDIRRRKPPLLCQLSRTKVSIKKDILIYWLLNVASNIEQVLAATPHTAPTVRPPTTYHEKYTS